MTTSNTTSVVEAYLAAKAAWDAAEAALRDAKKDACEAVGGFGYLEGLTADLDIGVQARTTLNEEKLMALGLTKAQIDACKVEGKPYPVVRVKPKKKMAA